MEGEISSGLTGHHLLAMEGEISSGHHLLAGHNTLVPESGQVVANGAVSDSVQSCTAKLHDALKITPAVGPLCSTSPGPLCTPSENNGFISGPDDLAPSCSNMSSQKEPREPHVLAVKKGPKEEVKKGPGEPVLAVKKGPEEPVPSAQSPASKSLDDQRWTAPERTKDASDEKPPSDNKEHDPDKLLVVEEDIIEYVGYKTELQMPDIMRLIQKDLSEPYSVYTYRYFIHNWPNLCFLAMTGGECVGAIVCKLDYHKKIYKRGYIAMLAVDKNFRKRKIGSTLVKKAIDAMIADDADEVVLETEITNMPALQLYENLGFVRDKRLFRYYLNGVDALRLKLWLR